ncbi:hypothetical protein [Micromonospora mirobrigensis]|uniref:Acetoacetate decarboxylase (ADC) n=1 Tax=Micromonospora mirobrigensis TaxID=262898 RepID=A0A1C4ZB35_9ACTN|nr:hypothetical protein [Micromonospora mirobrigensis]SCF30149.1 hypothetical protein GA0070564_105262 [Micromonospora mirobrigensis]
MLDPTAPQIVVQCRTLSFSWLPADPDAVAALVPAGLRPRPDRQVFLSQYVVDDETQTSGFGAYSLTYLGVTLVGADAPGGHPGGWWTHYLASSPRVRQYAVARGAPAAPGRTSIDVRGDRLTAVTEADGRPLIRSRCQVGDTGTRIRSGLNRILTTRDGRLLSGIYPFLAEPVTPFEVESVEFLDPGHPVYALRPANPLTIDWGFYTPRASFAYPGGLSSWEPDEPAEVGRLPEEPAPAPAGGQKVPARRARSGLPSGS